MEKCQNCENNLVMDPGLATSWIVNCIEEQIWRNVCQTCQKADREKKRLHGCELCKEAAKWEQIRENERLIIDKEEE